MKRIIIQIKYDSKMYNKFILIVKGKNKEEKEIYKARELIANKDVHIEYYNKLFVEGDFDNTLNIIEFNKIAEFLKKATIIKHIGNDFKEFEKILN